MMEHSSEIDWDTSREETIWIFGWRWNVSKAKEILINNPREIVRIDPLAFEPLLGGKITSSGTFRLGIGIDYSRLPLDEIDLSIPVIIVEEEDGKHMLIDGWHRLGKAISRNEFLYAVILTLEENKEIRIK